jgi:hypothetical protein
LENQRVIDNINAAQSQDQGTSDSDSSSSSSSKSDNEDQNLFSQENQQSNNDATTYTIYQHDGKIILEGNDNNESFDSVGAAIAAIMR